MKNAPKYSAIELFMKGRKVNGENPKQGLEIALLVVDEGIWLKCSQAGLLH